MQLPHEVVIIGRRRVLGDDAVNEMAQVNALGLSDGHGRQKWFEEAGDLLDYLCGWRSLIISLIQVNGAQAQSLEQLQAKVKKLELVIDQILTQQEMI